MTAGGKRSGAGRPEGAASKKSQEVTAQALEEGITPIEVMLDTMRESYSKYKNFDDEGSTDLKYKLLETALSTAKDAAPYCHPRLSSVDVGNKEDKPFLNKDVSSKPFEETGEEWLNTVGIPSLDHNTP